MLQYVQRSNIIYEKEINHIIVVFITLIFCKLSRSDY